MVGQEYAISEKIMT